VGVGNFGKTGVERVTSDSATLNRSQKKVPSSFSSANLEL